MVMDRQNRAWKKHLKQGKITPITNEISHLQAEKMAVQGFGFKVQKNNGQGSKSVIDLLLFMFENYGRILLFVGSEISPNALECGYGGG